MIQVFTAKPDKLRKDRIFNFLPKEIKTVVNCKTNFGETPGFVQNPFSYDNQHISQIDSGATPLFKVKKSNKISEEYWLDRNVKADFDKPDRYLYEFFNHRGYYKFKKQYFKSLDQSSKTKPAKRTRVYTIDVNPSKQKEIFLEIDKTIMLLSEQKISNMPFFKFIGTEVAKHFNRPPFYIYLRPFALGFLNAIK